MSRLSRTIAAAPLAAVLVLAPSAPVAAAAGPDTIDLQSGSLPEGITAGPGVTFFAGARSDGSVRQYSTRTGELLRELVPGREGEVAVGIFYDSATKRLFVAGGLTSELTVYDARTGALLYNAVADATTGDAPRFVNDVTVTRKAAYFTDSRNAELLVVPFGAGGELPASGSFEVLEVSGDYEQPDQGNGLNGIRALPTGDLLAVSPDGLFAIDPDTGVADQVEVTGTLDGGDGLVLRGSTLFVVNGLPGDKVVELKLTRRFESARVIDVLTQDDTDSDLDRPTTGALVGGDLYVVNGRFETIGGTADGGATLPFSVSRFDLDSSPRSHGSLRVGGAGRG